MGRSGTWISEGTVLPALQDPQWKARSFRRWFSPTYRLARRTWDRTLRLRTSEKRNGGRVKRFRNFFQDSCEGHKGLWNQATRPPTRHAAASPATGRIGAGVSHNRHFVSSAADPFVPSRRREPVLGLASRK